MKKIIYIIIFNSLLIINAQSLSENNEINLGVSLSKSNYYGDLATWNNSVSPELFFGLKWSTNIEYILFLNFTNFKKVSNFSAKKILLAVGLNYTLFDVEKIKFNLFTILTNSTFIFDDVNNNNIESEFGAGVGAEIRINISEKIKASTKYYFKNIFTKPENTLGNTLGIGLLYKL